MRLESLRLQHFRACRDVTVRFDGYTCLVGPNGAGKSTVLTALNLLFRNTSAPTDLLSLSSEDFFHSDTNTPVVITATFGHLTDLAKEEFKPFVRDDRLVVVARAVWDASTAKAVVKQFGLRLAASAFAPFFAAIAAGSLVAGLKVIYAGLRSAHPDLPAVSTKADMDSALRRFEETHPDICALAETEYDFYGVKRGSNPLARHVQWVYVPAVKDAASEQDEGRDTALGILLERTIRARLGFDASLADLRAETTRKYEEIIASKQGELDDLSDSLGTRLREWSHPGSNVQLHWSSPSERSVGLATPFARASIGEGDFVGEVARMGHGIQRGFILSLLQELASERGDAGPTLILGFEEPELYQHPPQARHLASVLEELGNGDSQVIVTTHSPYFISGRGFESARLFGKRHAPSETRVSQATYGELSTMLGAAMGQPPAAPTAIMATMEQILQPSQNELFFCECPVLVEGVEDVAHIATYLQLTGRWNNFRRAGCHFVVAAGKTTLSRPLAIALLLGMAPFVIFDGDTDNAGKREENLRDNSCLLHLCGIVADALSTETVWSSTLTMWSTRIGDVVRNEFGPQWIEAQARVREQYGFEDVQGKNSLLVAGILEDLYHRGSRSESLEQLCANILTHANAP